MQQYGLIGFPLSHSFSPSFFNEKFAKEKIDARYDLFPLENLDNFRDLWQNNINLQGLNVTIPYKEAIIPFLDKLDKNAQKIGAVNVIKKNKDNQLVGYNTDYDGFYATLQETYSHFIFEKPKAIIFGNGGASKAVKAVLTDENIEFLSVVRQKKAENEIFFQELTQNILQKYKLWINTTPVGMYPHNNSTLPIVFEEIVNEKFYLIDLIYNPKETIFLKKGKEKNAKIQNGLMMLWIQAEKAWNIWKSE
jgi:shikimate dehydrogenase